LIETGISFHVFYSFLTLMGCRSKLERVILVARSHYLFLLTLPPLSRSFYRKTGAIFPIIITISTVSHQHNHHHHENDLSGERRRPLPFLLNKDDGISQCCRYPFTSDSFIQLSTATTASWIVIIISELCRGTNPFFVAVVSTGRGGTMGPHDGTVATKL
jgi:hypothetical protein